jgi:hypothetical protein
LSRRRGIAAGAPVSISSTRFSSSRRVSGRLWPGCSLRSSFSEPTPMRTNRRTCMFSAAAMRRIWRLRPSCMVT